MIEFVLTAKAAEALSVDDGRVTECEPISATRYRVTCSVAEAKALLADAEWRSDPRMRGPEGLEQPSSWWAVCRRAASTIRAAIHGVEQQ